MGNFDQDAPLHPGVTLAAEHATGLIALSKPAGVLSHPNSSTDERRALLTCRYDLADESFRWKSSATGQIEKAWLLNRLDGATSGIVLLSRSIKLARHIREHFKTKQVQKIYAALVFGRPTAARGNWRDRLAVSKLGGQVRTSTRGNIPAETRVETVQSGSGEFGALTLLQLEPKTGRSHQLRVQCAHRRLPIVGDATYGDFKRNRAFAKASGENRLFLHSFRTAFRFDWEGQSHDFSAEAPVPSAFNAALTTRAR